MTPRAAFDDAGPVVGSLRTLALDLRWSWRPEIRALFRAIDPDRRLTGADDPWTILRLAPVERVEELAADPAFGATIERLSAERAAYLADIGWYGRTHGRSREPLVGYFSAEVGLDEALPLYSGGLGVLAGEHLKSASSLGVPLVGVSLLYAEGYFRQQLDASGWQHEYYPPNRFDLLPITRVRDAAGRPLLVGCPLPGRTLNLAVWRVEVGRVSLYLLDANVPANGPADRGITAQLYGGDREMRLQQEMALGIGGWRALVALGIRPPVCHLNEGHAAFAVLERARDWMTEHRAGFEVARVATAGGNVFTTHTPVAAGCDAFEPDLVRRYLSPYATELGLTADELLDLGRPHPGDRSAPLEMAVLALRFSGSANGVSRLHGAVSRRLFAGLFPRWPEGEVPIDAVTNGVHVATWVSDAMRDVWQLCYGEACWDQPDLEDWARLDGVTDEALWAARTRERGRLVEWARGRLVVHLAQRGAATERVAAARTVLDPDALTIGFARRFAEYKRPTLLLSQPERLRRLLTDPDRPVQLVIAGKAHPRDDAGKALIAEVVRFADDPAVRRRVVFLEDYDLEHAAHLVAGVDLWLNTPRYPMEASGTSGMKVLVNGGLNLSELDGWWAEAYEPAVGWALSDAAGGHPPDAAEADRLFDLLETEIVPAFYDRDAGGLPRSWLTRVRSSMTRLTPRFSSNRMVAEYVERHYLPAASRAQALGDRDGAAAVEQSADRRRLRDAWPAIAFGPTAVRGAGSRGRVVVPIRHGALRPVDVAVQLYREPGPDEEGPTAVPMQAGRRNAAGWIEYRAPLNELAADLDAYTARVVPRMTFEAGPLALPLIAWQR
ncbi:MAG: glycosyltransferase family 1 protein [Chloroflexi bacterium]|nr:glycosyltransferase family 1 protein [Chloroflexota bacterium]